MHTIMCKTWKKPHIPNILIGLSIVLLLCLLGGAIGIWQTPTPPPPLPETHATPLTPEEFALFQQWAAWINELMKTLVLVGVGMILALWIPVLANIGSRAVFVGAMLMLLILGTSLYLVNHNVQTEAARMTQEAQQGG